MYFLGGQWKSHYEQRLSSATSVLEHVIRDGNRIFIGSACAEPQHLVRALIGILPQYKDLELVQHFSVGALPEDWSELQSHCRLKTSFVGPKSRKAVNEGSADYIPIYISAIPNLLREDVAWSLDVSLIEVSPPDDHGFCSLGVGVDIIKAAVESSKVVVAQVNPRMPRTLGDTFLHVTQLHHFVEYEEPLIEIVFRERSALAERMARYVSSLVEDGSTIQVGVGRITNSVLRYLEDKKNLGIHGEIMTDAHLYLVKKGVITGGRKNVHPGKIFTFIPPYCELLRNAS